MLPSAAITMLCQFVTPILKNIKNILPTLAYWFLLAKKKHKRNVLWWSSAPMSDNAFSNHFEGRYRFSEFRTLTWVYFFYTLTAFVLEVLLVNLYDFCLNYYWLNTMRFPWKAFCNKAVAICTIFTGKTFPHISQGMKKHRFFKIFENYVPLWVFSGIMQIMSSELNYALSHPRIIPVALFKWFSNLSGSDICAPLILRN